MTLTECSAHKIVLESVTMVYGLGELAVKALDDCSLSVGTNEFLCLLGPSGCGKSTILHLAAGFLTPSTGAVFINKRRIYGPGNDRGIVFQKHNLFPWKRVEGNIAFGSRMQRLTEKERRSKVNEYLELMELSGFERHYPSQLSQGMQQRVSLARAYANEPDILLMDEPFASLDAQAAMRMRDLLLRIWSERRKTVVFVTHDIDEAIHLADRVLLMTPRPGRIKKEFLIELSRPRSWEFYSDSRYTELRSAMRSALLNE